MSIISRLLKESDEKKVDVSYELMILRRDFDAFRKRMEDIYINVCERHEALQTKLYKRVDYLERRSNTKLTPKQMFISGVAKRHGLRVEQDEDNEDDLDGEETITQE